MRAFWARGYEATSVKDLVRATGVNRGSLYSAYADKRELFQTALRYYDEHFREGFLDRIAAEHAPREAVLAVFESAAGKTDNPGGCLIVNTALELSPHDPEIRAFVNGSLAEVEAFFEVRLEEAVRNGTVPSQLDVSKTSKALLGLFLGLRVLARTSPGSPAADAIVAQAKAMLD